MTKFCDGRPIGPTPYDFTSTLIQTMNSTWRATSLKQLGQATQGVETSSQRHLGERHKTAVDLATTQKGVWPSERDCYAACRTNASSFACVDQTD